MYDYMTVLVTGGAGYIGSHMVLALLDAGHQPVILDDFSTGHEQLLPNGVPVFRGDVADAALVAEICNSYDIDAVAHFAASIVVPESVTDPLKYYQLTVEDHWGFSSESEIVQAKMPFTMIESYGGIQDERGYAVQQTSDGGYVIVGSSISDNGILKKIGLDEGLIKIFNRLPLYW